MKKNFSPEEKIAYRNEQMQKMEEMLENGVRTFFQQDRFKTFLNVMLRFPNYSARNTMMIAIQNDQATMVTSYKKWKSEYNRNVKRGAKALYIYAPRIVKDKAVEQDNADKTIDRDDNDNKHVAGFIRVPVFDVSQTEQIADLPVIVPDIVPELQGQVTNYSDLIKAISKVANIPIVFDNLDNGVKGYFSENTGLNLKQIVLQESMSQTQTIKTLLHETAHSILHNQDALNKLDDQLSREDKEIQAESVAYMVAHFLGIDTSEYSIGYVATWAQSDMKKISANMEIIKNTALNLCENIQQELDKKLEVQQERMR